MSNLPSKSVELAMRIEARESLYFFARYCMAKNSNFNALWSKNWHHEKICKALERVYRGDCKRLIINIPPRHSKTELAVVNFTAWALGKSPDANFLHVSYSATIALDNSKKTRRLVHSDAFESVFGELADRGNASSERWRTISGGEFYATGAGGAITGFAAGKMGTGFGGAIIVDDPHKANEANSDVRRKGVIEWFKNTLYSRRNSPDTPIIIIMQRLHEEDLSGWLLNGGMGDKWEHLCIPAVNEREEALWPSMMPIDDLNEIKKSAPYVFAGQYMQTPAPAGGGEFKREWFPVIDAIPAGTRFARGWDLAATQGAGDWTVGAKVGVMPDGRFVVADILRGRESQLGVERMIKSAAQADGAAVQISLPQDPGAAGKNWAASMVRMLAGYRVRATLEAGDKVTRSKILRSQAEAGNVLVLRGRWNADFFSELEMFPVGKHDDQIDATVRAFSEVARRDSIGASGASVRGL